MDLNTLVTSALTASIISGFFLVINSWVDRRARRKESIFNLAFRLAKDRTDLVLKIAMDQKKRANLRDTVFLAEEYYKWLDCLFKNGALPKEAHESEKQSRERVEIR